MQPLCGCTKNKKFEKFLKIFAAQQQGRAGNNGLDDGKNRCTYLGGMVDHVI
ncbi:MAG: hypothetical protein FWG87_08700 [Defluviitaleaceae bacterium]|nr:hypothetical protein [Defluviitaleaceae bacterium]